MCQSAQAPEKQYPGRSGQNGQSRAGNRSRTIRGIDPVGRTTGLPPPHPPTHPCPHHRAAPSLAWKLGSLSVGGKGNAIALSAKKMGTLNPRVSNYRSSLPWQLPKPHTPHAPQTAHAPRRIVSRTCTKTTEHTGTPSSIITALAPCSRHECLSQAKHGVCTFGSAWVSPGGTCCRKPSGVEASISMNLRSIGASLVGGRNAGNWVVQWGETGY